MEPTENLTPQAPAAAASVAVENPTSVDARAAAGLPADTENQKRGNQLLSGEMRGWLRDLLIAVGLAVVIIVFLYQPVKVEGTSMAPLLSDQERIFINKFVYKFESIHRGDVVVFWYPFDKSKSFIKRVVGLPGETVEIRHGRVYVNGEELDEPYVPAQFADMATFGPTRIPDGRYFVMGDHRASSNDSRVFGAVSAESIYGKAVFSYWPVERFGAIPAFASTEE